MTTSATPCATVTDTSADDHGVQPDQAGRRLPATSFTPLVSATSLALVLTLFGLALRVTLRPLTDPDLWWHLRMGAELTHGLGLRPDAVMDPIRDRLVGADAMASRTGTEQPVRPLRPPGRGMAVWRDAARHRGAAVPGLPSACIACRCGDGDRRQPGGNVRNTRAPPATRFVRPDTRRNGCLAPDRQRCQTQVVAHPPDVGLGLQPRNVVYGVTGRCGGDAGHAHGRSPDRAASPTAVHASSPQHRGGWLDPRWAAALADPLRRRARFRLRHRVVPSVDTSPGSGNHVPRLRRLVLMWTRGQRIPTAHVGLLIVGLGWALLSERTVTLELP